MKTIFYGWWIVLATSLIHFWTGGTFYHSFTAFFNPIVDEFGWSYAATSFAASLRSIEGGIASPLVGFATDRFGTRRLMVMGSILGGLGFILLSRINSLWTYYLTFMFLSVGSSLLFPLPGWTALANWFVRRRGTALGIVSASIGVSGVLVYIINSLIGMFGWRHTLVIIGIVWWIIGIPSSLIVRHRPEPYGLLPDGEIRSASPPNVPEESRAEDHTGYSEDFSPRQAVRTRIFWVLALIMTLSNATVHAVMVHIMPYLISENFNRDTASIIASLLVLVSTIGRFGAGWLTAYINNRSLLILALLSQALGLFVLART